MYSNSQSLVSLQRVSQDIKFTVKAEKETEREKIINYLLINPTVSLQFSLLSIGINKRKLLQLAFFAKKKAVAIILEG